MTYAATTRNIVSAIRKLSKVGHPDLKDGSYLFRGLSGKLQDEFWTKDNIGVCATDLGFMSTSLNDKTPVDYMRVAEDNEEIEGTEDAFANVLWKLQIKAEGDDAYHCGAVISELSQYAGEQEVLFPPLTMLKVCARDKEKEGWQEKLHPSILERQEMDWEVSVHMGVKDKHGNLKNYREVEVLPYFV